MAKILHGLGARVPDEFRLAVALGVVPGYTSFRKFGMSNNVASGVLREMWSSGDTTIRTLQTTAIIASIVSDDAADTLTTGTGAWTVTVEGLDENLLEVSETVDMAGLTPVTTTQTFLRINSAFVVTAGTGEINAGNIHISLDGDEQTFIELDEGHTHMTSYTVPANKKLIVASFVVGVGRMSGNVDLHVLSQIKLAGANTAWGTISDVHLFQNIHNNDASTALIPPGTDIRQLIDSTVSTQAFSTFSGYLVDV